MGMNKGMEFLRDFPFGVRSKDKGDLGELVSSNVAKRGAVPAPT